MKKHIVLSVLVGFYCSVALPLFEPKIFKADYFLTAPQNRETAKQLQSDYKAGLNKYKNDLALVKGTGESKGIQAEYEKLDALYKVRENRLKGFQEHVRSFENLSQLNSVQKLDYDQTVKNITQLVQQLSEIDILRTAAQNLMQPKVKNFLAPKSPFGDISSVSEAGAAPVGKMTVIKEWGAPPKETTTQTLPEQQVTAMPKERSLSGQRERSKSVPVEETLFQETRVRSESMPVMMRVTPETKQTIGTTGVLPKLSADNLAQRIMQEVNKIPKIQRARSEFDYNWTQSQSTILNDLQKSPSDIIAKNSSFRKFLSLLNDLADILETKKYNRESIEPEWITAYEEGFMLLGKMFDQLAQNAKNESTRQMYQEARKNFMEDYINTSYILKQ